MIFLPVKYIVTLTNVMTYKYNILSCSKTKTVIIPPFIEWGLYCNHLVRPSVQTFVTDITAYTGRNDFIFDIWLQSILSKR